MKDHKLFSTAAKPVLALSILATILVGCGGGGSTNANTTPAPATNLPESNAANTSFAAVRPARNDWLMYAHDVTVYRNGEGAQRPPSYLTRTFNEVNADGTITYTETSSDTGTTFRAKTTTTLDTAGAQTRYVADGAETCNFTPSFMGVTTSTPGFERVTGNYANGTKWKLASQSSCQSQGGMPFNSNVGIGGSIAATETIVVRGVQYSAVKEVYSTTTTPGSNAPALVVSKVDYTCWRDTSLGRIVKCLVSSSIKGDSGGYLPDYTSSLELVGHSLHNAAAKTPPVAPYAGNWTLTYGGAMSGSCPGIRIDTSGSVSGECVALGMFNVAGLVKPDGAITINPAGYHIFSGKMSSPVEGSGTWSNASGGNGTWSIVHR